MNKKVLMIVIGGALLVTVATVLMVVLTPEKKEVVQVAEEKKVIKKVVVAARDLNIGEELTVDMLEWKEWPEEGLFPGAVVQSGSQKPLRAIEGRLKEPVKAGEPVTKKSLFSKEEANMVAARLAPGMRAVAINVSAQSMAGGFIGPGDIVDVVLTYRASFEPDEQNPEINEMLRRNLNRFASETLLEKVKVLAVDQMASREKSDNAKIGRTVTLAASIRDAEKLVLASEIGELTLVLRGLIDDSFGAQAKKAKDLPILTDARITNIEDEIYEEYKKVKERTGVNAEIVRIYNGGSVTSASSQ